MRENKRYCRLTLEVKKDTLIVRNPENEDTLYCGLSSYKEIMDAIELEDRESFYKGASVVIFMKESIWNEIMEK